MPTYAIECDECGARYDERLSFKQYDEVKAGTSTLGCATCGCSAKIGFKPGNVGFVMKDGESGSWASKAIKENKYRKDRREVMAKKEKDHVFKSNLQANYKGEETGSWREAQELARKENGQEAASSYDHLVKKELAP